MFEASRLAFDPLIPWLALWVLTGGAAVLWILYVVLRGKAWLFRALALSILALALANPLWIEEQREPLKDIVAVVMDRSESMNFRGRTETAQAAYEALKAQIDADETLELRIAETDPGADGTDMYVALQSALSDAPRERIAGAVMITDGQIHDMPDNPEEALQIGPVHALVVGGEDEIDRNIDIQQAPSFSIIDQRVEMRVQVNDPTASTVDVGITINGDPQPTQQVTVGQPDTHQLHAEAARRQPRRAVGRRDRERADARQQPRLGQHFRRAGPPARAAGHRRTSRRRTGVARPPEVGPGRRPRALHDPPAAAQVRQRADRRDRADRLPEAAALP